MCGLSSKKRWKRPHLTKVLPNLGAYFIFSGEDTYSVDFLETKVYVTFLNEITTVKLLCLTPVTNSDFNFFFCQHCESKAQ